MPAGRWSEEEIQLMYELYEEGIIRTGFIPYFPDKNPQAVIDKAKRLKLVNREYKWTNEEIELLQNLHNKGIVNKRAAEYFPNRSLNAVLQMGKMLGLKNENRWAGYENGINPAWVPYNQNFFENLNLISAYWAGFISADGSIRSRDNDEMRLHISLSIKDICVLEQFCKDIDYKGKIREFDNGHHYCSISLGLFNQCADDLKHYFNLTGLKRERQPPGQNLPDEFIPAYIIGLYDGDGSIGIDVTGKAARIRLEGTQQLLNWVRSSILRLGLSNSTANVCPGHGNNHFTYAIAGKPALDLIRALRKVEIWKLSRKWQQQWLLERL